MLAYRPLRTRCSRPTTERNRCPKAAAQHSRWAARGDFCSASAWM